jgi:hypothetical protein
MDGVRSLGGNLGHLPDANQRQEHALQITEFISKSAGLRSKLHSEEKIQISQNGDGKSITFPIADLEDVIQRIDSEGQIFLQVNFLSGKKILLTENLIGFKPVPSRGLDLAKLPKVVTTPDLISVVEAVEDSMSTSTPSGTDELEVLKRVFDSVLRGAEAVGFDTTPERLWMQGLARNTKASA